MKIRIYRGQESSELLFECDWIHGLPATYPDSSEWLLLFQNLKMVNDVLVTSQDQLSLKYIGGSGGYEWWGPDITPAGSLLIPFGKMSVMHAFDVAGYVDELAYSFAEAKACGCMIDWRDLCNASQKKAWLAGCRYASSELYLPIIQGLREIEIDGSMLQDEIDFYCLIAEKIHGKYSYCGNNPENFADCLSYSMGEIKGQISLSISSYGKFKSIMNKDGDWENRRFEFLMQTLNFYMKLDVTG